MIKCENCQKEVARRITRPDGKKVCRECDRALRVAEYLTLCKTIVEQKISTLNNSEKKEKEGGVIQ